MRAEIAIRLIEERGRVGYSAAHFAARVGISREGLRLYESGQRGISAEVLAASAAIGIDVQYVLTGARSRNVEEAERTAGPVVSISGSASANIVQSPQAGSNITQITTQKHVTQTNAIVRPGEEHISQLQALRLKNLVTAVVEHEERLKRQPKSYRSVYAALNAHCGVTRYLLIQSTDFPKAEKYLLTWIGRLNSMASAPLADNDAWRKRKYAYIKINTKDDGDWLRAYMKKNSDAESIADLEDDSLNRLYQAVAKRKNAKRA